MAVGISIFPRRKEREIEKEREAENVKPIIQMAGISDNVISFCMALTIFGCFFLSFDSDAILQ